MVLSCARKDWGYGRRNIECQSHVDISHEKRYKSSASLEDADQSRISGCLAASGSCMPSAADEGWHSPKKPYSTVAVNTSWVCTEVSCPFFLWYESCSEDLSRWLNEWGEACFPCRPILWAVDFSTVISSLFMTITFGPVITGPFTERWLHYWGRLQCFSAALLLMIVTFQQNMQRKMKILNKAFFCYVCVLAQESTYINHPFVTSC